jgi:long-chain acyl-CoA synthetase
MVMNPGLETNLIRRIALGDILRRRAKSHANDEAVVEFIDGTRIPLTYRQLNDRVNRIVHALRNKGLHQGDRVAILGVNSGAFLTALMGCFKGGFVAVPVNFLQNREDIRYNIDHSGAKAIFADEALHPLAETIVSGRENEFVLVTLVNGPARGFSQQFVPMTDFIEAHPISEIEDILIHDDDPAQIMYTSGTTSKSKGVMASHKNLFIATLNTALSFGVDKDHADSVMVLPMFHITAELLGLMGLHLGAKIVMMPRLLPEKILGIIESEKIRVLVLLPMMWRALLASPEIGAYDYSSLCKGIYGMAPMDEPTLKAIRDTFGCPLSLGSGQTEVAGVSTVLGPYWGERKQGNYWGDGSFACDQAIMDDQGNLLPNGKIGEIVYRSPQVMLGYYQNEEATAVSRAYGWHHSGDIGYIDGDNQLRFVDRKKDIVKTGGENVSSVKVEEALLALEPVANVCVVGLPHDRWGEAITAFIHLRPGYKLDEDQVIAHCKNRLGRFEVPKKIVFLDNIPMTATGKVKKHVLRAIYQNLYDAP